jgi:hypothetical protein
MIELTLSIKAQVWVDLWSSRVNGYLLLRRLKSTSTTKQHLAKLRWFKDI